MGGRAVSFERFAALLAEYKEIDPSRVTPDSSFEELDMDSLDVVELVVRIEDKFRVAIELDPDVRDVRTLAERVMDAFPDGEDK